MWTISFLLSFLLIFRQQFHPTNEQEMASWVDPELDPADGPVEDPSPAVILLSLRHSSDESSQERGRTDIGGDVRMDGGRGGRMDNAGGDEAQLEDGIGQKMDVVRVLPPP